ncbi:hypothetical protein ABT095_12475 [Kitasatospora sp. NPDC002227]|uniref:hypothetical protein n=1 Tax=Kitasatospora sp. NPDC002227 TaxID=3154773 RepID=UPI003326EA68
MQMWAACLWGLGGAGAAEGVRLLVAMYAVKDFPWRQDGQLKLGPYAVAAAIRLVLGVLVPAVFAASHLVTTPMRAFACGVCAMGTVLYLLAGRGPQQGPPTLPEEQPGASTSLMIYPRGDQQDQAPTPRRRRRGR